jgi:hypothetical protein
MSTPVGELARVESLRIARNPLVWLAVVPAVFWIRADRQSVEADGRWFLLIGYGTLLPGLVLCVAMILSVLRGRLEHTEELLASAPVGNDRRTVAHVVSTAGGAAVASLLTVGIMLAIPLDDPLGRWSPYLFEQIEVPRPTIAQLAQGPLAVVAVLAFVVALVRWVPTWLVVFPLAFMVMVQGLFAGLWHGIPADGGRWLFPLHSGIVNGEWIGCSPEDALCELPVSGFDTTTPWWHLGYLASATVMFGSIAVLRHRRDRAVWSWCVVSAVAVISFAVIQLVVADRYTGVRL